MKTTNEFLRDLPRTPIYLHIGQIHEVTLHLYSQTGGHSVNAVEMVEHSLREIAIASLDMLTPEQRYAEMMRRRRVDHPPANLMPDMRKAIREAFENMTGALQRMRLPVISPEAREINAAREYRAMLRAQRTEARVHLQREVARVRRELGLNETGAEQ